MPSDSLPIAFINEFDLSQCYKLNAGKGRFSESAVSLFRFGGNGSAEFGRGFECRNLVRRNDDRRILRNVPSGLLCALLELECPESSQIDVLAIFECSFYALHEALYHGHCVTFSMPVFADISETISCFVIALSFRCYTLLQN